jgi:hypothetical protein
VDLWQKARIASSSALARRGVGRGGKTADGDGNGSNGRGTREDLPLGAHVEQVAASIEDWVGCGGGSGAIDSSGTTVRGEVASFGERCSSGPRAITSMVEVLQMLGVSCRRIGEAAGGESRTVPSEYSTFTTAVPEGGD